MFRYSLTVKSLDLIRIHSHSKSRLVWTQFQSLTREQIFYNLINHHNRKRSIPTDLLSRAIENIHPKISERLSLLILSSAARLVHNATFEKRLELLQKVWRTLTERRARLTNRHYETFLAGLNENGHTFDPNVYLNELNSKSIPLTPFLYSLILNQYCRNGDVEKAEEFLRTFPQGSMNRGENIFSALIVARIKSGKFNEIEDLIKKMNNIDVKPTILTYREILIALIHEHQSEMFKEYFSQIDKIKEDIEPFSTLYLDESLIYQLLQQCLLAEEKTIFDFLLNKVQRKNIDKLQLNLLNLSNQCVLIGWHQATIAILRKLSVDSSAMTDKHWIILFRNLLSKNDDSLIESFLKISIGENLKPLDALLYNLYKRERIETSKILYFIELGESLGHEMKSNYFLPILLRFFSSNDGKLSNDELERLFVLMEKHSVPIESSIYTRIFQEKFHRFFERDFSSFLEFLSSRNLETVLDRFIRLFLNDVRHRTLNEKVLLQIVPFFRLHKRSRQEEISRVLFSITAGNETPILDDFHESNEEFLVVKPPIDCLSLFDLIESICQLVESQIPSLKRSIFFHLLQISAENQRNDLTHLFGQKCIEQNLRFEISPEEFHSITKNSLDDQIVRQIAIKMSDDQQDPNFVQQKSLQSAVKRRSIKEAFLLLRQSHSNKIKIEPSTLNELLTLVDPSIEKENFDFLYENFLKNGDSLQKVPIDSIFDLSQKILSDGDETRSINLIVEKSRSKIGDEFFLGLAHFIDRNSTILSIDGLQTIGNLSLSHRVNESIRKFWKILLKILLERTSPNKVLEYFSKSIKENGNLPYLDLFDSFIGKGDLNNLQEIVDIATNQHGFQNVSHDLAFTLIKHGKSKEAERIFQLSWFRVRNDRIHFHSLKFSEEKNLKAFIEAIRLTRDLSGVDQKSLFIGAIQVAVQLDQTEQIDWLLEEMQKNNIQLDDRHKKYLNAHSMSKGLNPKFFQAEEKLNGVSNFSSEKKT